MLAYLAAIVPIVASLYVCLSALGEYARQDHAARVFERLEEWKSSETGKLYDAGLSDEEIVARQHRISERRRMLLEYNGVDPDAGAAGMFNRMADPRPAPRADVRRQWVLLIGSAAGVVLLALDAIGSP